MNNGDFDDLAKKFASGTSRRNALRTLLGGGVAGMLGAIGLAQATSADAALACNDIGQGCKNASDCCAGFCDTSGGRRGVCACPSGTTKCSNACGSTCCPAGTTCNAGVCVCESNGFPPCGGQCCAAGTSCVNGSCAAPCPTGSIQCASGTCCPAGSTCTPSGACSCAGPTCAGVCCPAGDTCDPATGQCSCASGVICNGACCPSGQPCDLRRCGPPVGPLSLFAFRFLQFPPHRHCSVPPFSPPL